MSENVARPGIEPGLQITSPMPKPLGQPIPLTTIRSIYSDVASLVGSVAEWHLASNLEVSDD